MSLTVSDPRYWDMVSDHTSDTKVLWGHMFTGRVVNDGLRGIFVGGVSLLSEEARIAPRLTQKSLDELALAKLIDWDPMARVIRIPCYFDFAPAMHPNWLESSFKKWRSLPDCKPKYAYVWQVYENVVTSKNPRLVTVWNSTYASQVPRMANLGFQNPRREINPGLLDPKDIPSGSHPPDSVLDASLSEQLSLLEIPSGSHRDGMSMGWGIPSGSHGSESGSGSGSGLGSGSGSPDPEGGAGGSNGAGVVPRAAGSVPPVGANGSSPPPAAVPPLSGVTPPLPRRPQNGHAAHPARSGQPDPLEGFRGVAERLWALQEDLRTQAAAKHTRRVMPLKASDERLERLVKNLRLGSTEEECEYVLRVYAAEAMRDKAKLQFLNGETNWYRANFERTLGMPLEEGAPEKMEAGQPPPSTATAFRGGDRL